MSTSTSPLTGPRSHSKGKLLTLGITLGRQVEGDANNPEAKHNSAEETFRPRLIKWWLRGSTKSVGALSAAGNPGSTDWFSGFFRGAPNQSVEASPNQWLIRATKMLSV